jgi:polyisoprenoid-binding protein YceI
MATTWKIDPAHSEITFKVKHLMITTVTGYFKVFEGQLVTEGEGFNTTSSVQFSADIESIDTKNEQRDGHLKSEEFFDANKFPKLSFSGNKFEALGESATLQGDLTIKGVTKPISLDVEIGGEVVDPYGQHKAGFTFSGKISRKAFGLTWNAVTETGSVVVSDDVRLHGEVQLIKSA